MQSLLEIVALHATKQPDKRCIVDKTCEVSYSEYWRIVQSIASFLKAKGLKQGDRVVVQALQSISFVATAMGIQLAGGIFVPIEQSAKDERVEEIAKETEARIVIRTRPVRYDADFVNLNEIVELADKVVVVKDELVFPVEDDIAEILFTTGTTGDSKGIVLSHRSIVSVAQNVAYGVEMKSNNVELIPVPVSHSYGLRSYYASMYIGSSVVLMDSLVFLERFFTAIEEYGVTSLALVPAAIEMILKLSKNRLGDYSAQLDYVQSGSAALSEDLKGELCRLLPDSRLYNFYGSTEAGRCCVIDYQKDTGKISCIGKPSHNATVCIVDKEGLAIDSSREQVGLLAVSGGMNMNCYWRDLDATSRVLVDGKVITSDLAYIEDEYVYYVGRESDVINVGGKKVIPTEIENIANQHKSVSECICSKTKDALMGQVPKLYVVIKEGHDFCPREITDFLRMHLENYKVPATIEQLEALPRTYNGKLDRKALA